jgi:UDP-GlcNAc3NAcA epimerase
VKIVTIIGARPQFIKAAAVSREIARHADIQEIIIHTGQHFDDNMSEVFFREMGIPRPDYHLEVNSLGHGAMTGRMLEKIEDVLIKEQPDWVLVYGDTNSTLAGALAAKKLHIRVVHVEAGLRSFNMRMPEEVNRILTDRISDLLCCPTEQAIDNLSLEGFGSFPGTIVKTGDVMLDAALYYKTISAERSDVIARLGLADKGFVLCTVHRAENTDNSAALEGIVSALNEISCEVPIIMPLHPRTKKIIAANCIKLAFEPIDPVGYFDIIELLTHTSLVMTDSGGLQKEAYYFRKPCVTLREETEWVELVEAGANMLAGSNYSEILRLTHEMLKHKKLFDQKFYGSGTASCEIVRAILS